MKVTLPEPFEGVSAVFICFRHYQKHMPQQRTECDLSIPSDTCDASKMGVILSRGIARVSKEDTYCKETGRKLSLARAITAARLGLNPNAFEIKANRKAIWDAYFSRKAPKSP